jgi:hypothetical protein
MGIGLGLGAGGVFLDTSGINTDGEEISLRVDAYLDPNSPSTLTGSLGFLQVDFTDKGTVADPTGLNGSLSLDLIGASDGRWNPFRGDSLEVVLAANASAQAEFDAEVFLGGSDNPLVTTTIRYDQILGEARLSSDSGASFQIGSPEITLEDVSINVGETFSGFLGDTIDNIAKIIKPLDPVVELLTKELDLGIAKFSFLDIARLTTRPNHC